MLVLGFSSTNPAVSLAQLGTPLCLRGEKKEILSQTFPFPASPPHYLQSHMAPHPKVFIVLRHPLQRQSSRYRARHGSKLKGNPAKHLPPTDSTSPAGNAECPVEVPGAESLSLEQGPRPLPEDTEECNKYCTDIRNSFSTSSLKWVISQP